MLQILLRLRTCGALRTGALRRAVQHVSLRRERHARDRDASRVVCRPGNSVTRIPARARWAALASRQCFR